MKGDKEARARVEHENTKVQEVLKFLNLNCKVYDCRQKDLKGRLKTE